jgi:hypothetical protein
MTFGLVRIPESTHWFLQWQDTGGNKRLLYVHICFCCNNICHYYPTSIFYCGHQVQADGFDGGVNCAYERIDIELNSG